jgi:hypothetical protein
VVEIQSWAKALVPTCGKGQTMVELVSAATILKASVTQLSAPPLWRTPGQTLDPAGDRTRVASHTTYLLGLVIGVSTNWRDMRKMEVVLVRRGGGIGNHGG